MVKSNPYRKAIKPGGYLCGLQSYTSVDPKVADAESIEPDLRETIRELVSGQTDWPLFVCGGAGTGKTCAGLWAVRHYGGWYAELPLLHGFLWRVHDFQVCWPGDGAYIQADEIWQKWRDVPLTVLDEIGARAPTDAQYETLKRAIDSREEKPAIVVSNLGLNELARIYDDRIASRLGAGTVHELQGDRR